MNNTLKFVLLIAGVVLIGYGLYTAITPEVSLDAGPLQVQAQGDNTQSYAMIGLGVLALIGGIAFRKR
ncbi:LPXTG cell wall anchor domain-containing protein [Croceibacter atlanticus]|uniref:LPXTG cell wall anchor domain-containing protein n=1 Tax=Croceibacter atlanticus TaxID=313588 RepID=UPI001C5F6519|nr:LPXTG cell wall anchor domain-containing protein [Croceibacter atlanticus]MBW4969593.1 LPXTG cell wall anchor domain-containing protein [Croceibacter atlanticus]